MRILLLGNYAHSHQQSMQRFAALLERVLTEAGHEVRLLRPETVLGRLMPGEAGLGKWLKYVDQFVLFPPCLKRAVGWADVVHICDQANAVYVPRLRNKPHVVTCHDVLAIRSARGDIPQNSTRWSGRIFQRWILRGLKQAQRVTCVSEQTRVELLRVTGLSSDRVAVVANALNYPYRPMSEGEALQHLQRLGLERRRPFLLHVGGNEWYKNREGLLRIFNALRAISGSKDYRLVMVGPPWTAPMRNYVEQAGLRDHVTACTNIANEDLRALYATAEALIFPSLYEGFGWPIIEAQACGCPVFTTGRPPMTEAGGSAAAYFDPLDERAAARTIAEGLEDRHKMVEGGIENAARFSTEAMVHGYLAAYQAVIAETASQHHSAACPE